MKQLLSDPDVLSDGVDNNQETVRSDTDLLNLSKNITQHFSFDHKTITDARKTVNAGIYTYIFDATTLLPYEHNLNIIENIRLDSLLYPFFEKMNYDNREAYKELRERRILLFCLLCAPKEYQECEITKSIRPDFILKGKKLVGIEVTELTTEFDKELFALSRQIQENGLNSKEAVQQHIQRYHKNIANRVEIINGNEKTMVSSGMYCLEPHRIHFAEKIKTKYDKYKDMLNEYDEFIILGNVAFGSGLDVSSQNDVQEVIDHLLSICPEIVNMTTIIAWREASNQRKMIHSWYKLV